MSGINTKLGKFLLKNLVPDRGCGQPFYELNRQRGGFVEVAEKE